MTEINEQERANQLIEQWGPRVADEEESRAHMPIRTMQNEATSVAELLDEYYLPKQTSTASRPGLNSMFESGLLPKGIADEIRDIANAMGQAQARYRIITDQLSNAPSEQGDELLDEMRAALSFLLEDGEHDQGQAQLDKLRDDFSRIGSQEMMASALEGYAELCEFHDEELKTLPSYDPDVGNKALRAAQALRQRYADRNLGRLLQEQREMLQLRNRLISALQSRMSTARRAVRFVFRDHPSIVRQAGSEYQRDRRRAARRAKTSTAKDAVSGHESTLEMPVPIPAPAAQT